MSVVAWDGKVLAADRCAVVSDMRVAVSKMQSATMNGVGVVLAWTGEQARGIELADWYRHGRYIGDWPQFQNDKELWTRLIVACATAVNVYEQRPVALRISAHFMAWGCGRDLAM